MMIVCNIFGLTIEELTAVTSWLFSIITWGVFAGILTVIALISFIDLVKTIVKRLFCFIKKFFRTFGKSK